MIYNKQNPLEGLRCLGSCRASSDPQTKDSIGQQLLVLQAACRERGMIWVGYEEETLSASEPGYRPDIDQFLKRKREKNDYDVILVQDRSRWTRSGQPHGAWLKVEFARVGVKIVSTTSKMVNHKYEWIEEGLEDEASNEYVRRLSFNKCRGTQKKIEDNEIAYTVTPPFGIDRLYSTAEKRPMHIIRNLRDGRQQRLDHETKEVLETYGREVKGEAKKHWRKQKSDRVTLVPGADDAVEASRFVLVNYYIKGLGYHSIAKEMNIKAMSDPRWLSPNDGRWGNASVEQIVHAPIYTGHGISNMWASGKFNLRDRERPRELEYDIGQMMLRPHKKREMRPPEDWIIKEYPALHAIIPDDALRQTIWEKQYDYLVRRATGQLPKPAYDKHRMSTYFLKHVLRCKETGNGLTGKLSARNTRYYLNAVAVATPDPARPWLSHHVPATPLEDTTKVVVREVLGAVEELKPMIRTMVERETSHRIDLKEERSVLQREREKIDQKLHFAMDDLAELGADAVKSITTPLKERRLVLDHKLALLTTAKAEEPADPDKTVEAVVDELKGISAGMDGLPPLVLRNLLMSFLDLQIDMQTFEIDLDVKLPAWAACRPEALKQVVSGVGSDSLPTRRGRIKANNENVPDGLLIASYACRVHKEKARSKPCVICKRKAA